MKKNDFVLPLSVFWPFLKQDNLREVWIYCFFLKKISAQTYRIFVTRIVIVHLETDNEHGSSQDTSQP